MARRVRFPRSCSALALLCHLTDQRRQRGLGMETAGPDVENEVVGGAAAPATLALRLGTPRFSAALSASMVVDDDAIDEEGPTAAAGVVESRPWSIEGHRKGQIGSLLSGARCTPNVL